MKFVARELKETKDQSRADTTTGEILRSIAGVVLVVITIYLALGAVAGLVAMRISPATERKLSVLRELLPACAEGFAADNERAQAMVDRMVAHAALRPLDYRVCVIDLPVVNALAAPGGAILLTRALVDQLGSEQELAMVLGHELGHFAQRDHLRGLGRSLLLGTALAILGVHNLSGLLQPFVDLAESGYSRGQESGADQFGLGLVVALYGHAGGAPDFFEKLGAAEGGAGVAEFLATHPDPAGRAARLHELIRERGYAVLATTPFRAEPR